MRPCECQERMCVCRCVRVGVGRVCRDCVCWGGEGFQVAWCCGVRVSEDAFVWLSVSVN